MSQLTVRNVSAEVVRSLKQRAAAHGRSAEAEHREILREALREGADDFEARAKILRERLRPASTRPRSFGPTGTATAPHDRQCRRRQRRRQVARERSFLRRGGESPGQSRDAHCAGTPLRRGRQRLMGSVPLRRHRQGRFCGGRRSVESLASRRSPSDAPTRRLRCASGDRPGVRLTTASTSLSRFRSNILSSPPTGVSMTSSASIRICRIGLCMWRA